MKYIANIAHTKDDSTISLFFKSTVALCAALFVVYVYLMTTSTISGFEIKAQTALQSEEQKQIAELERLYHEKKVVLSRSDAEARGFTAYDDVKRVSVTKEVYSLAR